MTEAHTALSPSPAFSHACVLAKSLEDLLEQEFEQLKQQDLDGFDSQQEAKSRLLNDLMELAGLSDSRNADDLGPEWDPFKDKMRHCRDLHRRNEILIHRKIDAIRGALQSLQCEDPASSVEIYDRLGKVSRRQRSARGYADV